MASLHFFPLLPLPISRPRMGNEAYVPGRIYKIKVPNFFFFSFLFIFAYILWQAD